MKEERPLRGFLTIVDSAVRKKKRGGMYPLSYCWSATSKKRKTNPVVVSSNVSAVAVIAGRPNPRTKVRAVFSSPTARSIDPETS